MPIQKRQRAVVSKPSPNAREHKVTLREGDVILEGAKNFLTKWIQENPAKAMWVMFGLAAGIFIF